MLQNATYIILTNPIALIIRKSFPIEKTFLCTSIWGENFLADITDLLIIEREKLVEAV